MSSVILTNLSGKTFTVEKRKYYQTSYAQYLDATERLCFLDLTEDQRKQAISLYIEDWKRWKDEKKTAYLDQNIHEKINDKRGLKAYLKYNRIHLIMVKCEGEAIASLLDNLQEYQIRNDQVVNVSYEGMNLDN